jgi:hypothetical protein
MHYVASKLLRHVLAAEKIVQFGREKEYPRACARGVFLSVRVSVEIYVCVCVCVCVCWNLKYAEVC